DRGDQTAAVVRSVSPGQEEPSVSSAEGGEGGCRAVNRQELFRIAQCHRPLCKGGKSWSSVASLDAQRAIEVRLLSARRISSVLLPLNSPPEFLCLAAEPVSSI